MSDLTPKQQAFALAYIETGNAAEAYRTAYDVEPAARDSWIYVEASQLLDNPKIALYLEGIEEQAKQVSIFTRSAAMEELEAARVLAMGEAMPAAAVSAINGKVKLFGLDRPKKIELTGKDGSPIETSEVSARERINRKLTSIASRAGADSDTGGDE